MKIGSVSLYGPGHFNPMSALTRQLQDHLDIWSDPAIEMLAGIYRIAERLSTMPPPERQVHAMQAD